MGARGRHHRAMRGRAREGPLPSYGRRRPGASRSPHPATIRAGRMHHAFVVLTGARSSVIPRRDRRAAKTVDRWPDHVTRRPHEDRLGFVAVFRPCPNRGGATSGNRQHIGLCDDVALCSWGPLCVRCRTSGDRLMRELTGHRRCQGSGATAWACAALANRVFNERRLGQVEHCP